MGFGFSDKDIEDTGPEIEYKQKDLLIYHDWEELKVGMKVQSLLTGTMGMITELSDEWHEIRIAWVNDNQSFANHKSLNKVIRAA